MITPQERIRNGFTDIIRFTREVIPEQVSQIKDSALQKGFTSNSNKSVRTKKPPVELIEYLNISNSLRAFIDQAESFAPYSVILGKCDDGLPLTMELSNPAPGSILITGDQESGKTQLLNTIMQSAILLNYPDRLKIHLITGESNPFNGLLQDSSSPEIHTPGSEETYQLIKSLVELIDERRLTPNNSSAMILAIDDLQQMTSSLNKERLATLFKLVRHGPRNGIWTIATIHTNQFPDVHHRMIEAFKTLLTGKIASVRMASSITGDNHSPALDLVSGSQFCIPVKDNWLKFWICE